MEGKLFYDSVKECKRCRQGFFFNSKTSICSDEKVFASTQLQSRSKIGLGCLKSFQEEGCFTCDHYNGYFSAGSQPNIQNSNQVPYQICSKTSPTYSLEQALRTGAVASVASQLTSGAIAIYVIFHQAFNFI